MLAFVLDVGHTVIMMQGNSLEQRSSSSSLWKVASFSTINTNLADDTMSGVPRIKANTNMTPCPHNKSTQTNVNMKN